MRGSAPRHPPLSPNPMVPEEFRCSGTDFTASSGDPGSSHGPVLATTHFPLEAAAHTRAAGGATPARTSGIEPQTGLIYGFMVTITNRPLYDLL
jgi:hypothetical protein